MNNDLPDAGETFIHPGTSFSLKFDEPGVYEYLCHIHPGMQGIIVVEPKA